jgi:hypothetical protein
MVAARLDDAAPDAALDDPRRDFARAEMTSARAFGEA